MARNCPPKDQPPNHYRLLGVDLFEDDREVIDAAANRVMSYLKDLAVGDEEGHSQRILNEVMQARICLLAPKRKTTYDAELRAEQVANRPPSGAKPAEADAPPVVRHGSSSPLPVISPSGLPVARSLPKSGGHGRFLWMAAIGGSVALFAVALLLMFLLVPKDGRRDEMASTNIASATKNTTVPKSTDALRSTKAVPGTESLSAEQSKEHASDKSQTANVDQIDHRDQAAGDASSEAGSANESLNPAGTEQPVGEPSANERTTADPAMAGRPDSPGAGKPLSIPSPAPLPSAEDEGSAKRLVDAAFGKQIENATTVEQRIAVARSMFQAANDTSEEAPKRFVLLTEAHKLAIAAGNAAFANEIMDRLLRDFTVERLAANVSVWDAKAAILKRLSIRAKTSKDLVTVAESALAMADLAVEDAGTDVAQKLTAVALGAARKADSPELLRKATLRLLELQDGKTAEIAQPDQ